MRRLVVGAGYLGLRVARRWRDAGDEVFATTRGDRSATLAAEGLQPIPFDVTDPKRQPRLPAVDTVVFAVGRSGSDVSMADIHVAGLQSVLDALADASARLIYVSSTGVYAQDRGEWVDEGSPCDPVTSSGRACRAAERLLLARGRHDCVLRLAGLYGHGRVPLARRIAAGAAIPGSPDAYLNLLHVDDAASAVLAAADHDSTSGEIFLVSDGHPITRREYVEALAARQGIVAPPLDGTGGLGKRVRNTRALRELGLRVSAAIDAIGRD